MTAVLILPGKEKCVRGWVCKRAISHDDPHSKPSTHSFAISWSQHDDMASYQSISLVHLCKVCCWPFRAKVGRRRFRCRVGESRTDNLLDLAIMEVDTGTELHCEWESGWVVVVASNNNRRRHGGVKSQKRGSERGNLGFSAHFSILIECWEDDSVLGVHAVGSRFFVLCLSNSHLPIPFAIYQFFHY